MQGANRLPATGPLAKGAALSVKWALGRLDDLQHADVLWRPREPVAAVTPSPGTGDTRPHQIGEDLGGKRLWNLRLADDLSDLPRYALLEGPRERDGRANHVVASLRQRHVHGGKSSAGHDERSVTRPLTNLTGLGRPPADGRK